nr:Mobile element protein [Kibdelosporangium sp. MJ126-NF4]CTQ99193.1 Mobile element protein [Kibdelosporangium sp. MJ126-NF4]
MIGKPSSPVRREAARKRTSPTLAPRCAADPSAWLFGYHRLTIRYDRHANHFCAFLTLAATLTCYKKLRKATT